MQKTCFLMMLLICQETCDQLLQGFVECLDADEVEEDAPLDLQEKGK